MDSAETVGKIKPKGLQMKTYMTNKKKFLKGRGWSESPRT